MTKKDSLSWFEIFVPDFDRAKKFYDAILLVSLEVVNSEGGKMAVFPYDPKNGVGGSLTHRPDVQGGSGGTLIYLNVEGDLDGVLSRVPKAGGSIVKPRWSIGEHGFIAWIQDVAGNVVGLHSMK